jgi:sugar phosphate isomerase/epimerase
MEFQPHGRAVTRFALCNEVVRELPFERQCAFAAALGYDGVEVAPFTLGPDPHLLPAERRGELRRAASEAGAPVMGLHWLLVVPEGLSITSGDRALRIRTLDIMRRLIGLCADLGGRYLVHGSPKQRRLEPGRETEGRAWAAEAFAAAAEAAGAAGLVYCVEPLAAEEANYVTSVAEAAELVRAIGHPALRTMVDCAAATRGDDGDPAALLRQWLPTGLIAHVHANDTNRRGPGEGQLAFRPILAALRAGLYEGAVGVEPFIYEPDGPACAARAIGYLRGCIDPGG